MSQNQLLVGKAAVVTGCARGIGSAILERFAAEGAHVWAHARTVTPTFEERCAALAAEHGVEIVPLGFDLTNRDEMKGAVKRIMAGPAKVNILVNNAGITLNALHQMTAEAALREQLEVNFIAPFMLTQAIVKLMLRNGGGSIVNISSSAAIDGNPGRAAYGASKAALATATRSLSREVGSQGIRANVIAPGITQTEMIGSMTDAVIAETVMGTDLRRMGLTRDIAGVAVFLASDLSSYVTGQVLRVDGGM